MIDVSLYSTEPGSKRVTVCIQDFEVAVLIVAQLHKAAEAALDKSDYGKLSKLAHEANELMQAVTLAFKSEGIPEELETNINLKTGEIIPPDGYAFANERNSYSQYNELAVGKASCKKLRATIMSLKKATDSNSTGYTRPKEAITYHFGSTGECWVSAYPQQTWEFYKHDSSVEISSYKHHITLQIPIDDFDRHWVIKKKKEGCKSDKKRVDSSNQK